MTFGGGDPFAVPFLRELLLETKKLGLYVHVDTNGIGLIEAAPNASLLTDTIDLLGLPLDGPDASTHDGMRRAPGHFSLVHSRLRFALACGGRVKINTIVTGSNLSSIPELVRLVATLRPARWSVYEYWPLSNGTAARPEHENAPGRFAEVCGSLDRTHGLQGVAVEVVPASTRRRTYPILRHDGTAYIHRASPHNDFEPLGSIFDPNCVSRLIRICKPDRPTAAARYMR